MYTIKTYLSIDSSNWPSFKYQSALAAKAKAHLSTAYVAEISPGCFSGMYTDLITSKILNASAQCPVLPRISA